MTAPPQRQDLYPQLNAASAELARRLGRAPNASELAAELGLNREDVIVGLTTGWHYEAPSNGGGDCGDCGEPRRAEAAAAFEKRLEESGKAEMFRRLLAGLPRCERAVVLMRFSGAMTQTQIAAQLGIPQPQVSRLLANSLRRMRDQVR